MPDIKSKLANMVSAYTAYVKGKTTSQGVSDNRKAETDTQKTKVKGS